MMNLLKTVLVFLIPSIVAVIHFIPHSHDDLGWLRTIDQYYSDTVRLILDSTMKALNEEPIDLPPNLKRKFVYSEMGYLKMWINEDPEKSADKIKLINKLLDNGKLEFVNGGMSMADTACPHYEDIINNYHSGLSYMERLFNTRTQIAWEIDPFGHSSSFYYIAKKFGLHDALIMRIPEDIKSQFAAKKLNNFVWQLPNNEQITIHWINHYRSFVSLSCETYCANYNFNAIFFSEQYNEKVNQYNGDSYSLYGDDFTWSVAEDNFNYFERNLRNNEGLKISLFSEYLQAFEKKNEQMYIFEGDFFPYVNQERFTQYWTGYFTSKPNLKHKIRRSGKLLRTLKNFLVFSLFERKFEEPVLKLVLDELRDISELNALLVHHDTITGTSKDYVDVDYKELMVDIENRLLDLFMEVTQQKVYMCDFVELTSKIRTCGSLIQRIKSYKKVRFHILNPTTIEHGYVVKLTIPKDLIGHYVTIYDKQSQYLPVEVHCPGNFDFCFVRFSVGLKSLPLFETFTLEIASDQLVFNLIEQDEKNKRMLNGFEKVDPDPTKKFSRMQTERKELKNPFGVNFHSFGFIVTSSKVVITSTGETNARNEIRFERIKGANSDVYCTSFNEILNIEKYNVNESVEIYTGTFVEGGIIVYGNKLTYLIYKMKDKEYFEIEVLVKHDIEMNFYYEIVMVISSTGITNKENVFYTESNGLFEMKRQKIDKLEASIFPTTTKASINDTLSGVGMSVWGDRSRGVYGEGDSLHMFIQRTAKNGNGQTENLYQEEDVYLKFWLVNYLGTEKNELDIRNVVDLEYAILFEHDYRENDYYFAPYIEDDMVSKETELPAKIRMNTELISDESFLLRFQNVDRLKDCEFEVEFFLLRKFPNYYIYREVDFQFVFSEKFSNVRNLSRSYILKPMEFLCVLVSRN